MWLLMVAFSILMRSGSGGVIPDPDRLATTQPLVERGHAMTAPDCTTPIVFAEIARAPGYRFGDDGSVSSRRNRFGLRDTWHPIRPQRVSRYGYLQVTLHIGGVQGCHHVHRLILEAFAGPCPEGMEACHKDGNPANNRLDNLRWDTPKANAADRVRHGTGPRGSRHRNAKLTETDIPVIRQLRREGWTWARLAAKFGVSVHPIRMAVLGNTWSHVQ